MGALGSIFTLALGAFFGPVAALVGSLVFSFLTKTSTTTKGSRVSDFQTAQSEIGTAIPKIRGQMRVAGNVVWHRGFKEHSSKTKVQDGGLFGDDQYIKEYYYSNIFAISISKNKLSGFRRVWFDNKLVYSYDGNESEKVDEQFYDFFGYSTVNGTNSESSVLKDSATGSKWSCKFYSGSEDQDVAPEILESVGDTANNMRGTAYFIFNFSDLTEWGHRMPSIEVEVVENDIDDSVKLKEVAELSFIDSKTYDYSYNIKDLTKLISLERNFDEGSGFIEYDYKYNAELENEAVARFPSSSDDVNIFQLPYVENEQLLRSNYDTNISEFSIDGIVINNGFKQVKIKEGGFEVTNNNYNYKSWIDTPSFYSEIKEEDYKYRANDSFPFSYDYISKVYTSNKFPRNIINTKNYQVYFFEETGRRYRDGYSQGATSLENQRYISIFNNSKEEEKFFDIDGKKILSFMYYNNFFFTAVVAEEYDIEDEDKVIKSSFYVVNCEYDYVKSKYTLSFEKLYDIQNEMAIANYPVYYVDEGQDGDRFHQVRANNRSNDTIRSSYFDPRFNILINLEIASGYSVSSSYKIENGEILPRVVSSDVNEIDFGDYQPVRHFTNFNQYFNIIFLCQNSNGDIKTITARYSYFENNEKAEDFRVYLDTVVKDILLEASYKESDIDVSDLSEIEVTGYVYGDSSTSRAHIEKLQAAYLFDIYEEDFKIKAKRRGGSHVRSFDANEVGFYSDSNYSNDAVQYKIGVASSIELPSDVIVTYSSIGNAYNETTQTSSLITDHELQLEVGVPISMTDDKAKQISDIILTASHREIYNYTFNVSLENIDLNVSDIIKLENEYVRILDINVTETHIEITAISDSSNSYKSTATGTNSSGNGFDQGIELESTSDLLIFEAKPLNSYQLLNDAPVVFFCALPRNDKTTTNLFYDSTSSELVDLDIPESINGAIWGSLIESNTRIEEAGFDSSILKVDFVNYDEDELSTITRDKLYDSKSQNLVALISSSGNVEYIQVGTIEKVDDVYYLTDLLRERYNSTYIDVRAGAKLVVINDAINVRYFDASDIGQKMYSKLVSGSQSLETQDIQSIFITGENLKPHGVVDLNVDSSGTNVVISYNVVVENFGAGEWKSSKDVENLYIDFIVELYDSSDSLIDSFKTEDLTLSYDSTIYDNVNYITVTARNKRVEEMKSDPSIFIL